MQITCRYCNRPFGLSREEVEAALALVFAEDQKFHTVHCPHCGKQNRVSRSLLQRAAPGWKPQPAKPQES